MTGKRKARVFAGWFRNWLQEQVGNWPIDALAITILEDYGVRYDSYYQDTPIALRAWLRRHLGGEPLWRDTALDQVGLAWKAFQGPAGAAWKASHERQKAPQTFRSWLATHTRVREVVKHAYGTRPQRERWVAPPWEELGQAVRYEMPKLSAARWQDFDGVRYWITTLRWERASRLLDQLARARLAYEQYIDDFHTVIPTMSALSHEFHDSRT